MYGTMKYKHLLQNLSAKKYKIEPYLKVELLGFIYS